MEAILQNVTTNTWTQVPRYADCNHYIGTYYKRNGQRYTGLDDAVLRERLEKELNVDLKPNSSFWDNFAVRIGTKEVILNTDAGAEEELRYYFLRNHKRVAFGTGYKPGADYRLVDQDAVAKVANVKNKLLRQAFAALDKLTPEEMRKALRLFGYRAENVTAEVAESTLTNLVTENPQQFLDIWVNNKNKDVQFLIEEASAANIIRKNKTIYKYGTDILGYTLEDAILYLSNPKNQDVKLAIITQLQSKSEFFKHNESNVVPVDEAAELKLNK